MTQKKTGVKRYNLVLPQNLYDEVYNKAEKQGTTFVELIRKFIKLGLLAIELQEDPESALIIREGDTDKQLLIL